ncbi:MAG: TetR/AcrR family transcriptional regulator [Acidimicrobiales bacterium]
MGHKHSREEILTGALDAAVDDGLSQLTFGRLAKRLGVSDRIIVYYFPTKEELVSEVLVVMGLRLQDVLAQAFASTATDHVELVRAAWPVLARPEIDPIFALFFEVNGLAAAGREPYRTLVTALVHDWITLLAEFFTGSARRRRTEAETAIALLDGLLLLRQLSGPAAANRAAARLGLR